MLIRRPGISFANHSDAAPGLASHAPVASRPDDDLLGTAPLGDWSLSHLRAVSELLPSGIVIAQAPSGRILHGNARARRILRRDVTRTKSSSCKARAAWFDADGRLVSAAEFPLARAAAGEAVDGMGLQFERGDGTLGWIRVSAAPVRNAAGTVVFAIATVEEVPRRPQPGTRTLFEHSPLEIMVLRVGSDGVVRAEECDAAFYCTTGLRADQVIGQPIQDAMGEIGAGLAEDCHICLAQGAFERQHTLRLGGGERVVRSYYRPLPDEQTGVRRVLLTQIDLTESRRVEGAVRQAMRLEAIGQLTGGVAHEFNNVLTAVLGNLDLLTRRLVDARQLRWAQSATAAARRGATLTHQLLAYARKQFMAPAATDIPACVGAMTELIRGVLGSRITLVTEFDPATWPALADPAQLELALLNLLTNARDAMPEGGRVQLSTSNCPADNPALPAELERGDYVLLAVADTGIGMPPDILARAMEPFFTTKGVGEGSGLGLSQAYGVARQLGGTIRLRSEPGKGTAAHIFLPRAVPAASL